MGLKFCNEAVISLKQLWPNALLHQEERTQLQVSTDERLFETDLNVTFQPRFKIYSSQVTMSSNGIGCDMLDFTFHFFFTIVFVGRAD